MLVILQIIVIGRRDIGSISVSGPKALCNKQSHLILQYMICRSRSNTDRTEDSFFDIRSRSFQSTLKQLLKSWSQWVIYASIYKNPNCIIFGRRRLNHLTLNVLFSSSTVNVFVLKRSVYEWAHFHANPYQNVDLSGFLYFLSMKWFLRNTKYSEWK